MRKASRPLSALALALLLAACGSTTTILIKATPQGQPGNNPHAAQDIGFPGIATKNTTRVDGADPIADAAAVALAVYPSAASGTHPRVVALAPTDNWQAAIASAVLSAPPIRAPILLSGSSALPSATANALATLAPSGSGAAGGAQVIAIGDVPKQRGRHVARIPGSDPFSLAAAIDRFVSATNGHSSPDVVVTSADSAAYPMPAAGCGAESGDPVLIVSSPGLPIRT